MSQDDYETLHTDNFTIHLLAGAMAGFMEFCIMFPIDTIKTRMQSLEFRGDTNIFQYLRTMMKKEGTFSPLRGITPIAIAAGPAHGLYFANYELVKKNLTGLVNNPRYDFICHGIAGSCATLFHDSIMNPSEVVKQRMQMQGSTCKNTVKCVVDIYVNEGFRAFYRSFFTTVMMNVPFQSVHFVVYEICQNLLNPKKIYSPASHVVSGGIAGGLASAVTNPLDVCKTLLNTQEGKKTIETLSEAAKTVYNRKGISGFLGGIYPRVMYTMPSTAICWFTYESFKFFLRNKSEHNKPKDK